MKFKIYFLVTIFIALCSFNAESQNGTVKVYIMAGQSNMVGYGKINPDNISNPKYTLSRCGGKCDYSSSNNPTPNVRYFSRIGDVGPTDNDTYLRDSNLIAGRGKNKAWIGPEFGFGNALQEKLPNQQIAIIKTAWGGADLAVNFKPNVAGNYYDRMKVFVDNVIHGHYNNMNVEIAGFIWFQGENDGYYQNNPPYTNSKHYAANYRSNLVNFIKQIRKDFSSDMKIVVATTGNGYTDSAWNFTSIVSGQKQMIKRKQIYAPGFNDNIYILDTNKYWIDKDISPNPKNWLHWSENAVSIYNIGVGMAACIEPAKSPCTFSNPVAGSSISANFWLGTFTYTDTQNNSQEVSISNVTYGSNKKQECIAGTGSYDGCAFNATGFRVALVKNGQTNMTTFTRSPNSTNWTMKYCADSTTENFTSTSDPWTLTLRR